MRWNDNSKSVCIEFNSEKFTVDTIIILYCAYAMLHATITSECIHFKASIIGIHARAKDNQIPEGAYVQTDIDAFWRYNVRFVAAR